MKITRWTAVMVSMLPLAMGACAQNTKLQARSWNGDVGLTLNSVAITVANNNFADMKVYAVDEGGQSFRIGTVTGLTSATIRARSTMFPTGTLRLLASPIGGSGAAQSGPLRVSGGQSVQFTIQADLNASYGIVR